MNRISKYLAVGFSVVAFLLSNLGADEPEPERSLDLLSPEKYLSVGEARDSRRDLYKAQVVLMDMVAENKMAEMAPNLVPYLDYPRDLFYELGLFSSRLNRVGSHETARKTWPAFNALLELGHASVPPLRAYIENEKNGEIQRLMALHALYFISKADAESALGAVHVERDRALISRGRQLLDSNIQFNGPYAYDAFVFKNASVDSSMPNKFDAFIGTAKPKGVFYNGVEAERKGGIRHKPLLRLCVIAVFVLSCCIGFLYFRKANLQSQPKHGENQRAK